MAQAAKAAGKPSVFARLGRYFSDVRAEMRRVVWPSRPEVINSSGIVLVTLIIFLVMILIFDQASLLLVNALGSFNQVGI